MSVRSSSPRTGWAAFMATAAIAATPAGHAADTGLRVIKDPVTGELRGPTHEEFKAMREQEEKEKGAQRSPPPARSNLRRNAHGGIGNYVGERFMSFSVVKRDADGNLTMQCFPSAEAANQAVTQPQSSAAPNVKEEDGHEHR